MINRNAKASLPVDAQRALTLIRDHIDSRKLATLVAVPMIEAIPGAPIDGFAAIGRGGMSLFFVDASNAGETGEWMLQMSTVVGVDCKDVTQALLWANDRNRRSAIDRYYCAITADYSMCAIAADTTMSSVLLDGFLEPLNRPIVVALKSLAENTLHTASAGAAELPQELGCRQLTTSDQDLMTLFIVASG